MTILIQRENSALPAKDEFSDRTSEPRTEQGGSESRKLRATTSVTVLDASTLWRRERPYRTQEGEELGIDPLNSEDAGDEAESHYDENGR